MPTLSRFLLLAAASALSFVAGCGQRAGQPEGPTVATAGTQAVSFASPPWLRQHLPGDTIAYLRLPSLWGLLSAPNQRGADAMYANPAHDKVIGQLRQAVAGNAVTASFLGSDTTDRVLKVLSSVQAPVEIAFVASGKVASAAALALVSTAFEGKDPAAVSALLDSVLENAGFPSLRFGADGFAVATATNGATAAAHFDGASGRLDLLAGMGASRTRLQTLLDEARDEGPRPHAMHALEQEIDAGGQGLLLWIDAPSVKPYLLASLAPDNRWLGHLVERTGAFAFGWGGVGGHGRLGLRVQLDDPAWMRYLPAAPRRFELASAGEPTSVVTLAIPDAADIERILFAVGEDFGAPALQRWEAIENETRQETGLSLREWLAPYGSEVLLFDDDAGGFSAVRLRNRDALKANIDRLTALGSEYTVRTVEGVDIHHLLLRAPAAASAPSGDTPGAALLAWWRRQPMHLYWIEDGDWLVHSPVPQPLIDRIALKASQPIDAWLRERHGDDRSQALASASTRVEGAPRAVYRHYLGLLALLGDVTNSPVDLFALPTARQLGLPARTGAGMQLVAGPNRAGIDLNYQHTPLDGLMSGPGAYGSIVVVSILAAIAIPSYQDYVMRSRLVQAVAATRLLQQAIIRHHADDGRWPGEQALAGQLHLAGQIGDSKVQVEPNGMIFIRFDEAAPAGLRDVQVALVPYRMADGKPGYVCGLALPPQGATPLGETVEPSVATTVPSRLLPAECQSAR